MARACYHGSHFPPTAPSANATMPETIAIHAQASPGSHQVLGACPHDCPDTCSLLTTVENGIATKVQGNRNHPQTDGVLCTKVSRYTERTYHPERILTP